MPEGTLPKDIYKGSTMSASNDTYIIKTLHTLTSEDAKSNSFCHAF